MNVTRTGSVIRTLGLVNTLRGQSFFTILTSRWDKMSTVEERRIGAVVGALVADAAGIFSGSMHVPIRLCYKNCLS